MKKKRRKKKKTAEVEVTAPAPAAEPSVPKWVVPVALAVAGLIAAALLARRPAPAGAVVKVAPKRASEVAA